MRDPNECGHFEESLDLTFGVVQSEARARKLLLRHARHVLAELVAERNRPTRCEAFSDCRKYLLWI